MTTVDFVRRDGEELKLVADDNGNIDFYVKRIKNTADEVANVFVVVAVEGGICERVIEWFEDVEDAFDAINAYREGEPLGGFCKDDYTLRFIESYLYLDDEAVNPPDADEKEKVD